MKAKGEEVHVYLFKIVLIIRYGISVINFNRYLCTFILQIETWDIMNIYVLQWNSSGNQSKTSGEGSFKWPFWEELIAVFLDMALQTPSQGLKSVHHKCFNLHYKRGEQAWYKSSALSRTE